MQFFAFLTKQSMYYMTCGLLRHIKLPRNDEDVAFRHEPEPTPSTIS
jgi:hypothetical protein